MGLTLTKNFREVKVIAMMEEKKSFFPFVVSCFIFTSRKGAYFRIWSIITYVSHLFTGHQNFWSIIKHIFAITKTTENFQN